METVSNLIVQTLCNTIDNLELIYLFGSRATGQAIAPSDWDIAFKAHAKLPPLQRWEAQEALANALKREVDLIDLLDSSAVLQLQVIQSGQLLFGETECEDEFGMQVYSSYGDWQSRRKHIVQDFVAHTKLSGD